MKVGKKGAIGALIVGVIAIIDSLFSTNDSLFPWQIKTVIGIGLVIYGLGSLLFQNEDKEQLKRNKRIAILIVLILIVTLTGYFYFQDTKPEKRTFNKPYGIFEVKLGKNKCSGQAILEGDKLTLQIEKVAGNVEINNFTLFVNNTEVNKKSIKWVCALMGDLSVIRCSTELGLPKNNFDMFIDKEAYTIMYIFNEQIVTDNIQNISFNILTDEGEEKITIREQK